MQFLFTRHSINVKPISIFQTKLLPIIGNYVSISASNRPIIKKMTGVRLDITYILLLQTSQVFDIWYSYK